MTIDEIFEVLAELKKHYGEDIILIGSAVFYIHGIDLGRVPRDLDVLVKSSMHASIIRIVNGIRVDVHFRRVLAKEYDEIRGFKVSTLANSIADKAKIPMEKHITDIQNVEQNINIQPS